MSTLDLVQTIGAAIGACGGTVGAVTGAVALRTARAERRHRLSRESSQDRAAAEQPIRELVVSAADHRLVDPTSPGRPDSDDSVSWSLKLSNPSTTALTVTTVTTTHRLTDRSWTPWGSVAVNRTVHPGETVTLPGQVNHWPRADARTGRGSEEFDVDVRDPAGRTWRRGTGGTVQLTEGTL